MTEIAQGDLLLEDELGNLVDSCPIHIQNIFGLIYDNISAAELEKTFCLQFIDQHGDTTFNWLQAKFLLKEFEVLLDNAEQLEEVNQIKSIIKFISKIDIHLYIKFIGD